MIDGSRAHPVPFPPVTPIDTILEMLKLYVSKSTRTSFIDPVITGWARAVFPNPDSITIFGGLITSKLSPPFKTLIFF